MIKLTVTIINKLGLHARASAKFVSTASRFQSTLSVLKDSKQINGKSIMSVMLLGATKGTALELIMEGPDEQDMATALTQLITERFHEPE